MKLLIGLGASLFLATSAYASPATDYLKSLDGNWRGGGVIEADDNGKETRVRCSLRNNMGSASLDIAGRCASSAGTRPIRGELSASGNTISSSTVRLPGVGRMRDVRASLSGSTLTLTGNVSRGGKAVPIRTRITPNGSALTMAVQSQVNGRWSDKGTLSVSSLTCRAVLRGGCALPPSPARDRRRCECRRAFGPGPSAVGAR